MLNEDKKDNLFYLIRYLKKLIDKDFDARLSEHGLTGQQGRILFFIYHHDKEVHQNDIENEFHLSKSTVSGLVKRMEKKGFIDIKKQHPYAVISVSNLGHDVINHLATKRIDAIEQLTSGLNEEDKQKVCEYLVKLIKNMEGGNE